MIPDYFQWRKYTVISTTMDKLIFNEVSLAHIVKDIPLKKARDFFLDDVADLPAGTQPIEA
jgi:hypothetical protein